MAQGLNLQYAQHGYVTGGGELQGDKHQINTNYLIAQYASTPANVTFSMGKTLMDGCIMVSDSQGEE